MGKSAENAWSLPSKMIQDVWNWCGFADKNGFEKVSNSTRPMSFSEKTNWFNGVFSMPHPEMELLEDHEKSLRSAMQAVYPSTEKLGNRGITNRVINKIMQQLFIESKNSFSETLSPQLLSELKLISKSEALFNVHFPKNQELLAKAQYRLKFEELFYIQLQLIIKNLIHKSKIKGFPFTKIGDNFNTFFKEHLPFELTNAQKRVIKEIRQDLGSNAQMNRLLQGDVGSGKTIVALMSMLIALDNDFQACLMAPTAILSVQHYTGLKEYCKSLNISIKLLVGSTKTSERRKIHESLENGSLDILIGTHALLEDKVKFKNLGTRHYRRATQIRSGSKKQIMEKKYDTSTHLDNDCNAHSGEPWRCLFMETWICQ